MKTFKAFIKSFEALKSVRKIKLISSLYPGLNYLRGIPLIKIFFEHIRITLGHTGACSVILI